MVVSTMLEIHRNPCSIHARPCKIPSSVHALEVQRLQSTTFHRCPPFMVEAVEFRQWRSTTICAGFQHGRTCWNPAPRTNVGFHHAQCRWKSTEVLDFHRLLDSTIPALDLGCWIFTVSGGFQRRAAEMCGTP